MLELLQSKGLESHEECIELAYQILLNSMTIQESNIKEKISGAPGNNRYRINVNTQGLNDKIYVTMKNGTTRVFSKNLFLEKKRIRRDLIATYKPMGLYVKDAARTTGGDTEGAQVSYWTVDLFMNNDHRPGPSQLETILDPEPEHR